MSKLIKRRKLYEQIAELIQEEIAHGLLKVGEQLPSERDIMAKYGVGRAAVREALFALAKMGLIAISSGERARVIEPSPAVVVRELSGAARLFLNTETGIRQFQEARLVFETALARRAAEIATAEDLATIRAALDANLAAHELKRFAETDVAFHGAIAKVGGNPIFPAISDAVTEWLYAQRHGTARVPRAAQLAREWHEKIYQAIAAHDVAAADAAMRGHIEQVNGFYWQLRDAESRQQVREATRLGRLVPHGA